MSTIPYPGLRPFQREESHLFFGREVQVDQLLDKLQSFRFMTVVGVSGCGKSSLVRAGMMAALESGFMADVGPRWEFVEMRPGNQPTANLAQGLVESSLCEKHWSSREDAPAFLAAILRRGPLGLIEVLRECGVPEKTNVMLLVDQFEEIFRFRLHGDPNEATAFVNLLLASAHQEELPIYVVVTMRSDFLGDCSVFTGLPEAINDSQFLVPRLTREQCQAAILGPAAVFGGEVEPKLVNQILNDIGTNPDQLPLMQHALMRVWNLAEKKRSGNDDNRLGLDNNISPMNRNSALPIVLTTELYDAAGGMANALSKHADEAYDSLSVEDQRIAELIFRALSERGPDQRDTRRPVPLASLAEVAGVPMEKVTELIEVFRRADRCFLTPPSSVYLEPDTVIDISHESLVRQWQRMNRWVRNEAESAQAYQHLSETAALWQDGKAALWSSPDLDNALAWISRESPSPEWARRYSGDFDVSMQFLNSSVRKRERTRSRKRIRIFGTLAVLALIGIVTVYTSFWKFLINQLEMTDQIQSNRYVTAGKNAELQREDFILQLATSTLHEAQSICEQGYIAEGLIHFAKGLNIVHNVDASKEDLIAVYRFNLDAWSRELHQLIQILEHPSRVNAVQVSHDGNWLATACNDGKVRIWKLIDDNYADLNEPDIVLPYPKTKGSESADNPISEVVTSIAFHPKKDYILAGYTDGKARLWELPSGNILQTIPHTGSEKLQDAFRWPHNKGLSAVAFTPDGNLFVTAGYDGYVRVWRTEDYEQITYEKPLKHSEGISAVAFCSHGDYLAATGGEKSIIIWDIKTGDIVGQPTVGSMCFAVDMDCKHGRLLAGARQDQTAYQWRIMAPSVNHSPPDVCLLRTAKSLTFELEQTVNHTGWVTSAKYSPDGAFVLTTCTANSAHLWDADTGNPIGPVMQHPSSVTTGCFAPDGRTVSTGCADGTVRVWRLARTSHISTLPHPASVEAVAFDADGSKLVTCMPTLDESCLKLWNTSTGQEIIGPQLPAVNNAVDVQYAPDNRTIFVCHKQGSMITWIDTETGNHNSITLEDKRRASRILLSDDGTKLVIGSEQAYIWDIVPGTPVKVIPTPVCIDHQGARNAIAITSNNQILVTGGPKKDIQLWNASTGEKIKVSDDTKLEYINSQPVGIEVTNLDIGSSESSFNGFPIVVCGKDGFIQQYYYDGRSIRSYGSMMSQKPDINDVAFARNCSLIISCSNDFHTRIWHKSGITIGPPLHHNKKVLSVDTNDKAGLLASGSWDKTAKIWQLPSPMKGDINWIRIYVSSMIGMGMEINLNPVFSAGAWNSVENCYEHLGRLNKVITTHDDDDWKHIKSNDEIYRGCRFLILVSKGQWARAEADLTILTRREITTPSALYSLALLQLQLDKRDKYAATCKCLTEKALASITEESTPVFWAAWTIALAPDALEEAKKLVNVAEKLVNVAGKKIKLEKEDLLPSISRDLFQPDDQLFQHKDTKVLKNLRTDYLVTRGALLYRAGQPNRAVKYLTEATNRFVSDPYQGLMPVYAYLFMALVQKEQGNRTDSEKWLAEAVEIMKQIDIDNAPDIPWNKKIALQLLRKEAEKQFKKAEE